MHEIRLLEYPYKKSKDRILSEARKIADRNGDYKNQISGICFKEMPFFSSWEKARDYIHSIDHSYLNVAVPFKGYHGRQLWLVKIEYHC